jgi:hypothetical protein
MDPTSVACLRRALALRLDDQGRVDLAALDDAPLWDAATALGQVALAALVQTTVASSVDEPAWAPTGALAPAAVALVSLFAACRARRMAGAAVA